MRDLASFAQGEPAIEIILGQAVVGLPQGPPELLGVSLLPGRGQDRARGHDRQEDGGHRQGRGEGLVPHRPEPAALQPPHRPCPARFSAQVSPQVGGQSRRPWRTAGTAAWPGPSGRSSPDRAGCDRSSAAAAADPRAGADGRSSPASRETAARRTGAGRARRPGCRCRCGGRRNGLGRRPARDSCTPACRRSGRRRHRPCRLPGGGPARNRPRSARPSGSARLPAGPVRPESHGRVGRVHHDIGRLDVAMDQAMVMGVVQGLGDLCDEQGDSRKVSRRISSTALSDMPSMKSETRTGTSSRAMIS